MSILPQVLPAVPPMTAPVDVVYLTITIHGHDYDLTELRDVEPAVAVRAWQMSKLPTRMFPDATYHAHQSPEGYLGCTCPDHTFRGRRKGACKHLAALVQLGFLTAEKPRQQRKEASYRSAAEAAEHLKPIDTLAEEPPF